MADFTEVYEQISYAKAITWDTCHKIYLLMDNQQVEEMRGYGYGEEPNSLILASHSSPSAMYSKVVEWYNESCGLRFVSAITSVEEGKDPNEGFYTLISQFDDEVEECDDCGQGGCAGVCNDYEEDEEED